MSIKKLAAVGAYDYLTRQVAAQDATVPAGGLTSYYTERGEAPGTWVGTGLAGLGIRPGEVVTEEQMQHLFGTGEHPLATQLRAAAEAAGLSPAEVEAAGRLDARFRVRTSPGLDAFRAELKASCQAWNTAAGRPTRAAVPDEVKARLRTELGREFFVREFGRPPASERELLGAIVRWSKAAPVTVAGFDLSFSPSKSVSALWALADPQLAAMIERCHQAAVRASLDYIEHHALYTRLGTDGARQVDVQGLVAVSFTHRDSRAGDPDLHTHVAIANKVQTLDGRWRAIDARVLYQAHVAASEVYDTTLMAHLAETIGVRLVPKPGRGRNPAWEIDGIDPKLCKAWSSRRSDITDKAAELAAKFRAEHGRPPTGIEMIHLAQQANLATREAKHEPRTLAEQRATWRHQAEAVLGADGIDAMLARTLDRDPVAAFRPSQAWAEQIAASVVEALEGSRATWQETHVRAEVLRHVRGLPIPTGHLTGVVDQLVDTVLTGHSWPLEPADDGVSEPGVLRRLDGSSVYTVAGQAKYSSSRVMAAEQHLLATAGRTDGRRTDPALVEVALLESVPNGTTLNHGQADLVRAMATSGRRLQLAIAPAGTGKTTALTVLKDAWAAGGGDVIGLAPSAAAADVLREHVGGTCDTLAKLAHSIAHPETAPTWVRVIGPSTLVIIDEAGMADTPTLDLVVSHITNLGGSVRLVGDDHQLTAVAAGGILADIATTHGALRLDEVLRFDDPAEAAASLALRRGDPNAIGFYADNNRLHPADAATIGSQVLTAWYADRHRGRDAIMLAGTRDLVAQLNHAARQARLDGRHTGREVALADGNRASDADLIITRRNNRQLRTGRNQWVKNGDRWQVTAVHRDGSIDARHLSGQRSVHLPPDYVEAWCELGYATTIHTAQGVTADTCHGLVTGSETRQQLYTMATRGRQANHLHIQTTGDGQPDPLDLDSLVDQSVTEILERVLAHDEQAVSATTARRQAADPAIQLAPAVARYTDALGVAAEQVLGAEVVTRLEEQADQLVLWLSTEPAWPTLRGHLLQLAAAGHDPVAVLHDAVSQGGLDDAHDVAAVLDWRIDTPRNLPAGPLPWLPGIPGRLAEDPIWGVHLTARAHLIHTLNQQVRASTEAERPLWAGHTDVPAPLVEEIRAWRAAASVPDHDLRPTGPPAHTTAGLRWQHRLDAALADTGLPDLTEWWDQLAPLAPHIASDPQIRALGSHLNQMAIDGIDVRATLADAINDGPLPVEHTLGALAYRLERHRTKHTRIPRGWPPIVESRTVRRRPEDEPSHHHGRDRGISI
ncbi:MAG TPA: MobF family relaxase [Propionicimonas sp.]